MAPPVLATASTKRNIRDDQLAPATPRRARPKDRHAPPSAVAPPGAKKRAADLSRQRGAAPGSRAMRQRRYALAGHLLSAAHRVPAARLVGRRPATEDRLSLR